MAAFDDATVTIDTGEMTYTDRHEQKHVVNNAETFVFELVAASTGARYTIKSDSLALATGERLELELDKVFSSFQVPTDATAALNAGSLWIRETDGYRAEWKIRSITINNVDEPTVITAAKFERVDNPVITMTLTNITVTQ